MKLTGEQVKAAALEAIEESEEHWLLVAGGNDYKEMVRGTAGGFIARFYSKLSQLESESEASDE